MLSRSRFREAVRYNKQSKGLTPEQYTALIYHFQHSREDLADDGKAGPLTLGALDEILAADGPPRNSKGKITSFAPWDGPAVVQPRNRREIYKLFGNPGDTAPDERWKRKNIIYCHRSQGNELPGVPSERWVAVHRTVEPYLREALRRTIAALSMPRDDLGGVACPEFQIERIGCYVWRPIQHRKGNPLSLHSWGIAVDIDPHKNFARRFPKGQAPKPWSEEWTAIWPNGIPYPLVEAFKSCGFAWGADWDEDGLTHDHTFLDPMHFEWVARDGESRHV